MPKYNHLLGVRINSELQNSIVQESRKKGLCASSYVRSTFSKNSLEHQPMQEIDPQSILEKLYTEFGQERIDDQIARIDSWLKHWTERASRIDYSKPHVKIIKEAVEGTSDLGIGRLSSLSPGEKGLQNWEVQNTWFVLCQFKVQRFSKNRFPGAKKFWIIMLFL